jgi:hypothetical protein
MQILPIRPEAGRSRVGSSPRSNGNRVNSIRASNMARSVGNVSSPSTTSAGPVSNGLRRGKARSDERDCHVAVSLSVSSFMPTRIILAISCARIRDRQNARGLRARLRRLPKGYSVAFITAAALVHELMEARDERRLRALQKHLNTVKLLRFSASAMSVALRSSPAIYHSMNGPLYSARNGSPVPCSTGLPITSTFWK